MHLLASKQPLTRMKAYLMNWTCATDNLPQFEDPYNPKQISIAWAQNVNLLDKLDYQVIASNLQRIKS